MEAKEDVGVLGLGCMVPRCDEAACFVFAERALNLFDDEEREDVDEIFGDFFVVLDFLADGIGKGESRCKFKAANEVGENEDF